MKKKSFSLLFFLLFIITVVIWASPKYQFLIVTWGGNSREWNRILHLSGVRLGCSEAPVSCVQQVDQIAATQHVSSVFLAILLNPERIATDSASYGNLSVSHPNLVEVGFDDFVSQAQKLNLDSSELSRLLENTAANLKSRSSKLQLGITIYQDQLSNGQLDHLQLSDGVRQSIGLVHLYPHYRKERKSVMECIAQVKQVFPNARLILGNYAYDRREYLPCSPDSHTRCSSEEEISLFDQNLRENLRIASSGGAAGIEFFPGNFSAEASWNGWDNPRSCKQGERAVCIQNTLAMREKVREAIRNAAP
jgi:hypothetical protein